MHLSCLPVSFFTDIIAGRMSLAEWAAMGARLGLDAIDLSILLLRDRSSAAVTAARNAIAAEGMRVAMVTSYPDFTHPDPAQRERELAMEQEVVEVAAGLGASLVRVTTGQAHPETRREEGIAWAVDGLSRLAETTRHLGVTLVYENHSKPGVWEYTDFAEDPRIFLEVARGIAPAGIGINFDAGNAATFAEDPLALLDEVVDRVVSLHASDSATRGRLAHVLVGTGCTPYPALFRRLVRAGWDGWICIEEASHRGEVGVAMAIRYVRETWWAAQREC
ncbi:MAG TPA: sugar phosphate isomerase/epimerase [Chloroflexi bacterium]|jgi:sugar phosphate isomerase/epimerase|nr:sugar phosphate isomerase/epimerase [Chloroflexota bacterium]